MSSMWEKSKRVLLAIHRRLLPDVADIGWTPYLWLVYLGFVYLPLVLGDPSGLLVASVVAATAVFLVLYFYGFWTRGLKVLPSLIGIALLGAALAPFNFGASAFFIYASAFACQLGSVRGGIVAIASIVALAAIEWWLLDLHIAFLLPAVIFSILIGTVNIYDTQMARQRSELRLSHEEVRRLAATSERERIARDLHDILGHTLSLITLKAELARKLVDRDKDKALQELADLEGISRQALSEVREAVSGYRSAEIKSELASARLALELAGISFDYRLEADDLTAEVDQTLAMCLREAVTNIIRHSRATRCNARLEMRKDHLLLSICDNGRGGSITEGSGLKGMRERLRAHGGALMISTGDKTELRIRVPASALHESQSPHHQVA